MAEIKKQKFTCPKCGQDIELELLAGMEVPYDEDYKKRVMDDSFFTMHCKHCNMVLPFAYSSSYNDLEKKFLLWLVPNMNEEDQERIASYNERLETDNVLKLARSGYRFRVVRNSTDFREKILIFDAGLDDRIVEIMKVNYVPSILKQVGEESKIVGFYFDWRIDGQGGQWMIIFDNQKPMIAPFDMKYYEETEAKWKRSLSRSTPKGLTAIDSKWASDFLVKKMKKKK